MTCSVVIPARLASTRLERKVLCDLQGKPVLQHVWERVGLMKRADDVFIATDSDEIRSVAVSWGANVLMTSPDCVSGTERIASALTDIPGEFILNVQGDVPFVDPQLLDQMVERWKDTQCDLVTAIFRIKAKEDLFNPSIVKVVCSPDGQAHYFSRSTIPFVRDFPDNQWLEQHEFWGHIGLYGYDRKVLESYSQLKSSTLESVEALEQLRLLDNGYVFQTIESHTRSIEIDTPQDLEKAQSIKVGNIC